jgi:hypothetical protein
VCAALKLIDMPEDPLNGVQSIASTAGIAALDISLARDLYNTGDAAIFKAAKLMLEKGVNTSQVANWANKTRNKLKTQIRSFDFAAARVTAEQRNLKVYLDKIGPSYEQLKQGWTDAANKHHAPKSDLQIIESAGKTNAKVNNLSFKLKIAGGILILFDLGVVVYKVYNAK